MPVSPDIPKAKYEAYLNQLATLRPGIAAASDHILAEFGAAIDRTAGLRQLVASALANAGVAPADSYYHFQPLMRYGQKLIKRAMSQGGDVGTYAVDLRNQILGSSGIPAGALLTDLNSAFDAVANGLAALFVLPA